MELREHYRSSVMHALGGFQLVEEQLKDHIDIYYRSVRHLLRGKLHFDYHRHDINDAPLGRLIGIFSKISANNDLIGQLRSLVKHRDNIAHRALTFMYKTDTTDEQFHEMTRANHALTDEVEGVLEALRKEFDSMRTSTFGD